MLAALMRLLVTGGAGYIGSIVAQQLVARGDDVIVLDSLYKGHREAVPEGASFVQVDLLDVEAVDDVFASGPFDGVLHFAAMSLVGESVEFPERYYRGNVVGALNLLDAMRATGVPRLVFSSTAATYGEPDVELIDEDTPNKPVNAYGNSKLAVDRMLSDEARAHGLGAISLRYFNVAGASGPLGEDHAPETHLIPLVLQAAAGVRPSVSILGSDYPTPDGTAVRDYIHVEDLGRAHLLALDAAVPGRHDIYNLGSERGYSVREVIDTARRVTGREIVALEARPPAGRPAAAGRGQRTRPARVGLDTRALAGGDDPRRLGVAPGAPVGLLNRLEGGFEQLLGRERRVEHDVAGAAFGQFVIGIRDALEELVAGGFEPVGLSCRDPREALVRVDLEQEREVGLDAVGGELVQGTDVLHAQFPAPALVGERRVHEAVEDYARWRRAAA